MIEPTITPGQSTTGSEISPGSTTGVRRSPLSGPRWHAPVVYSLVGGSSHDFATGRIKTHESAYGPIDELFYQRAFEKLAEPCRQLGCAARWLLRETFGRWRPQITSLVAATGWQDCPAALNTSWFTLLVERASTWELIQYIRHGEGQYPTDPSERAHAFASNLVDPVCDGAGRITASTGIDGLPLVAENSIEAREIEHAMKLGVPIYSEGFPEQHLDKAMHWMALRGIATWRDLRSNPPRIPHALGQDRLVILDNDAEGRTPEQLASFMAYCALHDYTPALPCHLLLAANKPVAELQAMAGRTA